MVVLKVQSDEELSTLQVANPGQLLVVLFFTPWCGSSVKAAKRFAELSSTYEDVTFVEVDCDEAEAVLTDGVKALPCFRFIRGGEEVGVLEGALPTALEQMIVSHRREAAPAPPPQRTVRQRGAGGGSKDSAR